MFLLHGNTPLFGNLSKKVDFLQHQRRGRLSVFNLIITDVEPTVFSFSSLINKVYLFDFIIFYMIDRNSLYHFIAEPDTFFIYYHIALFNSA